MNRSRFCDILFPRNSRLLQTHFARISSQEVWVRVRNLTKSPDRHRRLTAAAGQLVIIDSKGSKQTPGDIDNIGQSGPPANKIPVAAKVIVSLPTTRWSASLSIPQGICFHIDGQSLPALKCTLWFVWRTEFRLVPFCWLSLFSSCPPVRFLVEWVFNLIRTGLTFVIRIPYQRLGLLFGDHHLIHRHSN